MNDESLFHAALALPTEQRGAFLDRTCGDRPELRAAVESMLAAHASLGSFLAQPVDAQLHDPAADYPSAPPAGSGGQETIAYDQIARSEQLIAGRYLPIDKIGAGGMGEVWIARQTEPIRRDVALKFIKSGVDVQSVAARFEQERQALAIMDHPNIARVLDGGTTHDGRPFFVMELVKGLPITEYCDSKRLTPEHRLRLFVPVCQAIQHAHQKGIVHRDIKPSNVLVATYDDRPVPKVIDFGVAKAMGPAFAADSPHTAYGRIVGTPQYMSPEQASLNTMDIDTRSDVYSLGALLYELLTGSPPFAGKQLEKAGVLETLRVVREEDPPRPSTRLSSADLLPELSASRSTDPRTLTGILRHELDWIVMKALEKDRARRYQTANDFAADIERYLGGEPVQAHPPSGVYRVRKLLRRHRGFAIAAATVAVTVIGGLIGTSLGLVSANRARDSEATQRSIAESEADRAQKAEAETLADFRAGTDDAIEQLIGSKPTLGAADRAFLERTLARWQAFAARRGDDRANRAIRGEGHFRVAALWERLGSADKAIAEFRAARDVQEAMAKERPDDSMTQAALAATRVRLGKALDAAGQKEAAGAEFAAALAARSAQHETTPTAATTHDLAVAQCAMADHLASLGKLDAARSNYAAARDLCAALVANGSDSLDASATLAHAHRGLGDVERDLAKHGPSHAAYVSARDILQRIVDPAQAPPAKAIELSRAHASLANASMKLHRFAEAKAGFEAAIAVETKLVERFPSIPEYKRRLAASHNDLGGLLLSNRKPGDARTQFRKGFELRKQLHELAPTDPARRRDLAQSHFTLAFVAHSLGNRAESKTQYEAARAIGARLVEEFPKVPAHRFELGNALANLGHLEFEAGNPAAARAAFLAALEHQKALVALSPKAPENAAALGGSYCNVGVALGAENRHAESLEWFSRAIETMRPVLERDPQVGSVRHFLRNTHCARAQAYERLDKAGLAIADWDRAVEFSPTEQKALYRAGRATARMLAGKPLDALAEVAELANPAAAFPGEIWYNFACIYAMASAADATKAKPYQDRAIEHLRRALRSGFGDRKQLAADVHLAPLRHRDDFRKLAGNSK